MLKAFFHPRFQVKPLALAIGLAYLPAHQALSQETAPREKTLEEVRVIGTAEDVARQALGASTITADDIERRPPANDLSEIIRTQPGVNLTSSGSSGYGGNNRQIDLRGMGPENTLILIDGKPVQSRGAAIMRRSGERSTRGDTNWVPADAIESIEIIRGPAAARYGSGAAGGVVNIITKKGEQKFSGGLTLYTSRPEHADEEGNGTNRVGFNLSGPIADSLSFRLYGNVAKTAANKPDVNADAVDTGTTPPAGVEGVRNRDINGLIRWELTPNQELEFELGYSRQGNIYAGDVTGPGNTAAMQEMAEEGKETRRTIRKTVGVTHRGKWGDLGDSRLIIQRETTTNQDGARSNTGGGEGAYLDPFEWITSDLTNDFVQAELHTPLKLAGLSQVLTSGFEYRGEHLDDPSAIAVAAPNGTLPTDSVNEAKSFAAYLEDNIALGSSLLLTPGVRVDHHDQFGTNWSPSLNATYEVTDRVTVKGGIARAFKAPNLYQSNENYWYNTMGNGCPVGVSGPCRIQGNPDLDAEVSINKEIGVAFTGYTGWQSSLTYFHNDYQNKIVADMPDAQYVNMGTYKLYKWYNGGAGTIDGLEGSLTIPLLGDSGNTLKLSNNLTYMLGNENDRTGQPLTIIPEYTVNSTLDWRPTAKLGAQLTATFYGKQEPRTVDRRGQDATGDALQEVDPYAIFGLSVTYDVSKNLRLNGGVNNLADKRLLREGSNSDTAGAATYNEAGRAYSVSMTASF